MATCWIRRVGLCMHRRIGALMLGLRRLEETGLAPRVDFALLELRRLEKKGQVPLVDLAVLEEALDRYTTYMNVTRVTKFYNGKGRYVDRESLMVRLSPDMSAEQCVLSAEPIIKYLLEVR